MNMINTILETIGEDFAFLSDKAKTFIKDIDNDDIDEFESQINIYILLTRDSEDEDDKFNAYNKSNKLIFRIYEGGAHKFNLA